MLFIRIANRLLQDISQLTYFCMSLILKQLELRKASNILFACFYTFNSAAYSSVLTAS